MKLDKWLSLHENWSHQSFYNQAKHSVDSVIIAPHVWGCPPRPDDVRQLCTFRGGTGNQMGSVEEHQVSFKHQAISNPFLILNMQNLTFIRSSDDERRCKSKTPRTKPSPHGHLRNVHSFPFPVCYQVSKTNFAACHMCKLNTGHKRRHAE